VTLAAVGAFALLLAIERVLPLPLAITAVLAFGALWWVEQRAADPVMPPDMLRSPRLGTGLVMLGIIGAMLMGILTWLPLRLMSGDGAVAAGAALSPLLVGWPIAATASPSLMLRFGRRTLLRLGAAVLALAAIALAGFVGTAAPLILLAPIMMAMGVGFGLISTTTVVDAQATVARERRGVVTALGAFARSLGGALGVAALGALRGLPGPDVARGMFWVFVGMAGLGVLSVLVAAGYEADVVVNGER
jgi:MFS family permease